MTVKINPNYYFEVDENQFTLHFVKPQKKDPNKSSDVVLGYFTSLERLIKKIIQHHAGRSPLILDLDTFLEKWEAYGNNLSEKLAKMNLS